MLTSMARSRADHPRLSGEHDSRMGRLGSVTDHPRLSGEHPTAKPSRPCSAGSSPPERGALPLQGERGPLPRIIPA